MLIVLETNDLNLIYTLDQQCFNNEAYKLNVYEKMQLTNQFYLIKNSQTIVGFIILQQTGNDLELIKIGILKQYRHQHLAYNALKQIIDEFKYENFFLEVKSNNLNAIKLYEKLGFKTINIRKQYYHDNSDALIMQLVLS